MGATYYSMQWAEEQWVRLKRGERLSQHDTQALLLVYREEAKRLRAKLTDVAFCLRDDADRAEKEAEKSAMIAYRDHSWRLRGGGPFDDDETDI